MLSTDPLLLQGELGEEMEEPESETGEVEPATLNGAGALESTPQSERELQVSLYNTHCSKTDPN